jgi:hypothetical protein
MLSEIMVTWRDISIHRSLDHSREEMVMIQNSTIRYFDMFLANTFLERGDIGAPRQLLDEDEPWRAHHHASSATKGPTPHVTFVAEVRLLKLPMDLPFLRIPTFAMLQALLLWII